MKKIVIVGGGTAGWLTALFINRTLPCEVTLIESEEIGILGAGEGTTPMMVWFLDYVGIPVSEIVSNTSATFKNGIKFTNWTPDGSYYYHNFHSINSKTKDIDSELLRPGMDYDNANYVMTSYLNTDKKEFDLNSYLNEDNRVPFLYNGNNMGQNVILDYDRLSMTALHFNAREIAKYFRQVAEDRGVKRIEGKISDTTSNENGDITHVHIGDEKIEADFVFDCTGFARLLIGKHFNSEWVSHSDKLPAKAAIPFFVPEDNSKNIAPYTESIGMKYGWMWKIPVQGRYGCGYVFDSDLISEEDAKKEIDDFVGYEVESPKTFKFTAGYYKTPWVNNCVAVGLSSGFIEPLEATSIAQSIESLRNLFKDYTQVFNRNPKYIAEYNKFASDTTSAIADFLYFHYMGGRKDTEFWSRFQDINNAPEFVKNVMDKMSYKVLQYKDFWNDSPFYLENWFPVAYGLGMIKQDIIVDYVKDNYLDERFMTTYMSTKYKQKDMSEKCMTHRDMLKVLGGFNENK